MLWDLLVTVIVGLIAGLLAKAILPGDKKEPSGWLMTALLGIAGAFLVGLVMSLLHYEGSGSFIGRIIGATIGAIVIILALRKFTAPNSPTV